MTWAIVAVLAVGLATYQAPGPLYNAGVRFIVGQEPTESTDLSDEERLANFIATIAGAALENAEGFHQLQKLNETLEQRGRKAAREAAEIIVG